MQANAEHKAELLRQGSPAVAQNKGRYAWVRLHPGEETGINPRASGKSSKRWPSKDTPCEDVTNTSKTIDTNTGSVISGVDVSDILPMSQESLSGFQTLQQYISPYI